MFIPALKGACLGGQDQAAAAGGLRHPAVTLAALDGEDLLDVLKCDSRPFILVRNGVGVGNGAFLMEGELLADPVQRARRGLNPEFGVFDVLVRLREHVRSDEFAEIRNVLFRRQRHRFDLHVP